MFYARRFLILLINVQSLVSEKKSSVVLCSFELHILSGRQNTVAYKNTVSKFSSSIEQGFAVM